MPWWWHTEADTAEFYDPAVLETDARIYMTGALRLISAGDGSPFDVVSLWEAVLERVRVLETSLRPWLDLSPRRRSLAEGLRCWREAPSRPLATSLRAVRLLNRIYYAARDAHLQDWSGGAEYVPGLSESCRLLQGGVATKRAEAIVLHYAATQSNRLGGLASELLALCGAL